MENLKIMLYCTNHKKKDETAGAKAPSDVYEIARECGARELLFEVAKIHKNLNNTRIRAFFTGLKNWKNVLKTIENDSWIIIQHPNENILVANKYIDICKRKKNAHFIAIIHDLNSIRKSFVYSEKALSKRNKLADEVILKKCEYIICHNSNMKNYLINKGFAEDRILTLEIFDYLHNCKLPEKRKKEKKVVIAGNLMKNKCEYLYKLLSKDSLPFELELYGPNFTCEQVPKFAHYHGVCRSDELPGKLEGSFGLVWDGTEIDKCTGNAGEYIKYNNPHKCSLFLASNMPVIIWKHAALASFVEENGVGICVESLEEVGDIIDSLTNKEWAEVLDNVKKVGEKIRGGHYLKKSLKDIYSDFTN